MTTPFADLVPRTFDEAVTDFHGPDQTAPGEEYKMTPSPVVDHLPSWQNGKRVFLPYKAAGKLVGKTAIITGGDSGIGRAVAVLFAMEGVTGLTLVYTSLEERDATDTKNRIENNLKHCKVLLKPLDIGIDENCKKIVNSHVKEFNGLDILVNNAAEQHLQPDVTTMDVSWVEKAFKTNIISMFSLVKYATPHLPKGGIIINTTSVNSFKGNKIMLDYSATKGAITTFTRCLALQLAEREIRVNAVAPGPIWTPLICSTMTGYQKFGEQTTMGRAGLPSECATCFVFLASDDSSYISGSVLHPNGGVITGS